MSVPTPGAIPPGCDTIGRLFRHAVATRGERVALMRKELGIWRPVTWREYGALSRYTGLGLAALGLEPGGRVGVLAHTVPEWVYSDMGILGAGGVSVGVCATSSAEQVEHLINDSGARQLLVGDEEQLDKVLERRDHMPGLERVIVFDMKGLKRLDDPLVMSYEQLLRRGKDAAARDPARWDHLAEAAGSGDPAIIVYTSGTTGPPKGAVITHRNLVFALERWAEVAPMTDRDDTLAFLPLCHIAERVMTSMRPLAYGGVVHFVEGPDTVQENLREVSPTVFFSVPRVWEKGRSTVAMALEDSGSLERAVFGLAMHVGLAAARRKVAGLRIPLLLRLLWALADVAALRRTRSLLGLSRARLIGSGAAPISEDTMLWYAALGIPIFEMYGQTECTGIATFYRPDELALGTVGRPLTGTEVRLAPDGEILIRGPHVFRGYHNHPELTESAIRDGWLHTGDVGALTPEGRLKITDRKGDIIITTGGRNVTPSEIENRLKSSPYVSDAVVIGDGRDYLTALVMIDHDNVARYAQGRRIPFTDYASLTRLREIRDLVWSEVEKVNRLLGQGERVRKIHLLDVLLDAEDEQMTPTLKLRRKIVYQKNRREIEAMYGG